MDRQKLEKLYAGSMGRPERVFKRALSEDRDEALPFLANHVDELDVDVLSGIFAERLDPELEMVFVRRLATLVEPSDEIDDLLALSDKIRPEAWLWLTSSLGGKIPNRLWYRFVGRAVGCELFNAINDLKPLRNDGVIPRLRFPYDETRREPIVVGVLDQAHDSRAVAKHALTTVPVFELRRLHERFPSLITLDDIKAAVHDRMTSKGPPETCAPQDGEVLPDWLVPFCVERLASCDDDEASVLSAWLRTRPAGAHGAATFELALERFKTAVMEPRWSEVELWSVWLGQHLSTSAAWKTKGRTFIDLCIDLKKGFPPQTLRAALAGAGEHRASILKHVHDETAKLLLERTEAALKVRNYKEGDLLLSAFMSLDPGSFVSTRLHRLLKDNPGLPPEIVTRIEACKELARTGNRSPSEQDFYEVFLVLTGQMR